MLSNVIVVPILPPAVAFAFVAVGVAALIAAAARVVDVLPVLLSFLPRKIARRPF